MLIMVFECHYRDERQCLTCNLLILVHEDGDTEDDVEARALLNKFLGATALMSGIESKSGLTKEYLSGGGSSSRNQNVSGKSFEKLIYLAIKILGKQFCCH